MHYSVLNHSGCISIDGVNEAEEFKQLTQALKIFEISDEVQHNMFKIVAAVLHLCNIEFKEAGEGSEVKNDASRMLCVGGWVGVFGRFGIDTTNLL
jgi:myosin heavy subunit